jgi:hypothetical protein
VCWLVNRLLHYSWRPFCVSRARSGDSSRARSVPETHHCNPNVDPLARQELKHHCSLRREHARVLRLALLNSLFLRRARAILEWLAWGCVLRRWSREALGVRGRAESVWLCEDTGLRIGIVGAFAGFLQCGAGRGEAASRALALKGAKGQC